MFSQGRKKHQILFVLRENLKNILKVNLKHYCGYRIIYNTLFNIVALKVLQKKKDLITLEVPVGHDNKGIVINQTSIAQNIIDLQIFV